MSESIDTNRKNNLHQYCGLFLNDVTCLNTLLCGTQRNNEMFLEVSTRKSQTQNDRHKNNDHGKLESQESLQC